MVKNTAALCTFLLLITAAQVSHADWGIKVGGALGQLGNDVSKTGKQAVKDTQRELGSRFGGPSQANSAAGWAYEGDGGYEGSPLQKQHQQEQIRQQQLAAQQQARIRQQQIDAQRQQQQQFADNLSGLIDSTRQLGREIKAEKQRREQERQAQWQQQQQQFAPQPVAPFPYTPNPYAPQPITPNPYAPQQQPAVYYPQPMMNSSYLQPMPIQTAPVQYRGW